MSEQEFIEGVVTGYKATDKDMKCRDFQFEIGKWFEHEGDIEVCESGFHFCEQPSGVWAYYSQSTTRVFKVECEFVVDNTFEPGADFKRVCKRIRFVEEVKIGGNRNTGDRNTGNRNTGYRNTGDQNTGNWNTGYGNTGYGNTGDRNTGDRNTGNRNTGYRNTGNWNTGYGNTGYGNTGDRNTGDRNTGNRNTGYRNTGDQNTGNWNTGYGNTGYGNTGDRNTGYGNTGNRNTGYRNTGDQNTGDRNTGDRNTGNQNTGNWNTGNQNTGYGNATNYSAGYFCQVDPNVISFDVQTELTISQFDSDYPEHFALLEELSASSEIDFEKYKRIPGITPEKLKSLHEKHLKARPKNV